MLASLREAVSRLRFGCVLVTNDRDEAELRCVSEHAGSNVGTARVVAEIFSEYFFASVRSREARLDRHLRNGQSPIPNISRLTALLRK